MQYETIIIGGGPAGTAAAVYAARKKLKAAIITKDFGGQSVVSDDIQNWIGEVSVSGVDLASRFEKQVRAQEGLEIITGDRVESISRGEEGFNIKTEKGKELTAKTVLVAAGASRRKLGVPGEEKFNGRGVAYCSTCDAPLFGGREVVVVGGGNAGLEAVVDLMHYAKKIYLIDRASEPKGDSVTLEKVKASNKVEIITEAEIISIKGEMMVTAVEYKQAEEVKEISAQGVFVEIGSIPNSEMLKDLVKLNERGEVVADHKTMRSSLDGIWVAGDVADGLYKQNNTSAGDAIKAILNITEYLGKEANGY